MLRNRNARASALPTDPTGSHPTSPGHLVREYVRRIGWQIAGSNIVVEGTLDVRYFRLAAQIHAQAEQRWLLDRDLALFAVGERDRGGTKNLVEQFRVVRNLMEADPPEPDSLSFLILVDDDAPGRGAFGLLESLGFREYRDVLKLCRKLPRTSRNSSEIRKAVQEANDCFKGLQKCEIEDLVSVDLLDDFAAQSPGSLKYPARRASNGHHFEWHDHAKPGLLRHVEDHAIRRDVEGLIEFLKSLRYLLRLEPEGVLPA